MFQCLSSGSSTVRALFCNAVFVDETDLQVLAVRKRERIGESIVGARAVRIVVDLVGLADHEQAPVAQAQPPQSVRADGFRRPLLDRPILFLHIEVEPGVGVDPVDFRQDADEAFLLVDIELGLHRVMGLRRRRDKQSDTEQSDKKRRFAHGSSGYFRPALLTHIVIARLDRANPVPPVGGYWIARSSLAMTGQWRRHLRKTLLDYYFPFASSSGSGKI